MRDFFDVAVVGGSAIGGVAAAECARRGISTVILEEDPVVGKYRRCTSICSVTGLRSTGVPFANAVLNEIYGAVVHSRNHQLELRSKSNRAVVFDRQVFDESSIGCAVSNGAELRINSRVTGFRQRQVTANGMTVNSSVIIGADGAASPTAAAFQFPQIGRFAYCYEEEVTNVDVSHTDLVHTYFDNKSLRGFFGWVVPVDKRTARIGFGVDDPSMLPRAKHDFFGLKDVIPYTQGRTVRAFSAPVPVAVRDRTQQESVILVGDAAGQTKATTGGGLVFGSLCAKAAGESVSSHLTDKEPLNYENRWRKRYGLSLSLHRGIRGAADSMGGGAMDLAVAAINNPLSLGFLSTFADMDFIFKF